MLANSEVEVGVLRRRDLAKSVHSKSEAVLSEEKKRGNNCSDNISKLNSSSKL